MTEKITKLLDLAIEALSLYIRKTSAELGEALPLGREAAPPAKPPRAPRAKAKEAAVGSVPAAVATEPSPFETPAAPTTPTPTPAPEDALEAKRRCQEVMSLYVRRYLKATPPGIARGKEILAKNSSWKEGMKLEQLAYFEHVKLIAIFEQALEAADKEVAGVA